MTLGHVRDFVSKDRSKLIFSFSVSEEAGMDHDLTTQESGGVEGIVFDHKKVKGELYIVRMRQ